MLIFKRLLALCTFYGQYFTQVSKSSIISICKLRIKLLPLIISCFLLVCCESKNTKQVLPLQNQITISDSAVNINTASAQELEKLPYVGEKIAQRIVEFRSKYGKFRKPEQLLLVDGVSDKHFREMRNLIKVE